MALRPALVLGADGQPQQLQAGDALKGGQPNHVTNPLQQPYPASSYDDVWCSTAAAQQTVTLPASPGPGALVGVMRLGAYPVVVAANGNAIARAVADWVIDRDGIGFWFFWDASLAAWQPQLRIHA